MSIEDRFNAAVNVIRGLPKNGPYQPSNDMLLTFYSLFKQATNGKCRERKPAFWDIVKKAKWEAWNRLGEMPKEVAMQKYVDELKKIVETMSYTENVANFMEYSTTEQDTGVSISDLEMVAPEAIQKVRSRPNSPLASRDTSPARASPASLSPIPTITTAQTMANGYLHTNGTVVKPAPITNGYNSYHYQNGAQSDLSDDEYIDTVDDSETESVFRPIETASAHMSRSRMSQGDRDLYHSTGTSISVNGVNAEVTAQLARAIERLNASVQQVNNRISVVEQSVAGLRNAQQQQQISLRLKAQTFPPWWPFEDISPRLLALIILWPLLVSRMSAWLQRRK